MNEICQNIGGDWLLLGGALVQIEYDGERATEDIDLVFINHADKSRETAQNDLFKYTLGAWQMGPEFINLSVEFFVNALDDWQSEIQVFKSGPSGRIFKPSLTLFCALKMNRASELDINDIKTAIGHEGIEKCDMEKLKKWLSPSRLEMFKLL